MFLAAFVLLSSLFSIPASANNGFEEMKSKLQVEDEYPDINEQEPNDYFTEANSISLGDNVTGTMSPADRDMYKITIPKKAGFSLQGSVRSFHKHDWSN